ncbi:MAG: phenylalanine--tRNA ligase subunit alpha, partial [Chloroflexi bacterium]|nr:phenylalanine--tRNA ligase subunit alpha [Chloroflexota bacterium]
MLDELERLREEANRELAASTNLEKLEQWKARFLGKSGAVTLLLRGLGQLPPEQRPVMGREANLIRAELENRAGAREEILKKESILKALEAERIDVTLPGRPVSVGRLHPVTRVMRDITNIFALMGFQVVEGPEVELDRYNFELLNMPPDHPARDMWDTFYITDEMLLRTHTSPVQVR